MASPQLENGFTRIANEILEAVCKYNFNATQLKIILSIWRYTYGFGRKEHAFSLTFLNNATGISRRFIQREVNKLIELNVLTVVKPPTYTTPTIYAFNKNYDDWGCRCIHQQVKNSSTGEEQIITTGEQSINTPVNEANSNFASQSNNINSISRVLNNTSTGEELTAQERNIINKNIKINNAQLDDFFEKLWKLYPRKKGKGKVSYTQKKKLFNIGYDEIARAINRYKEEVKGKDIQYIQYGSSFFNHGFEDYLDKNYQQLMLVENKSKYKDMTNYEP